MTARESALLVLVSLAVIACGSTPASPTPETPLSASIGPTSTAPVTASAMPTGSAPPSPSVPIPASPTAATGFLAPGVLAQVMVRSVQQVADPEHPRSDAYRRSGGSLARTLEPLRRGSDAYLLESRVVDGREWWKIADSPYPGCCAPFGWVPATTADGSAVLGQPEPQYCPQPEGHLTVYDLIHPQWFDPAVCFGHDDVTLRGYLWCTRGLTIDAAYFLTGLSSWDETGVECTVDGRFDNSLTVYGDVATSLAEQDDYREFVDVTGHYFDRDSSECRWTTGNYMPMSVEGAPADTAEFACQMRFVATEISPLP